MARIAGVNIPDNKKVLFSLTYIMGVGKTTSAKILETTKVNPELRVKELSEADLDKIRGELDKVDTESDIKRSVALDIQRLQQIGSYRGRRHKMGLPVRGQNTKTNAKTRKKKSGRRGVAIAGKKK
ncbi:30S ribosomal protein S13 [Candidatus Gracilibacteria bacterium]|nr:30S ribosomal protein S13 [Candidatus Gracilibacteria bacterium]